MAGLWPSRMASGLAALSVACAVASLGLFAYNLSHSTSRVQYLYGDNIVIGMIFPLVGVFLIRRRPGNVAGWVLLASCLVAVNALAGQYAVAGFFVPHARLPGAALAAWVGTWAWAPELAGTGPAAAAVPGRQAPVTAVATGRLGNPGMHRSIDLGGHACAHRARCQRQPYPPQPARSMMVPDVQPRGPPRSAPQIAGRHAEAALLGASPGSIRLSATAAPEDRYESIAGSPTRPDSTSSRPDLPKVVRARIAWLWRPVRLLP